MAGYAQDDFRVTNALTVTAGLRYEYETGLAEKDNRMTVGFDRERAFPVQVPGMNLRGGLMYAGVDGYQAYQADPSGTQFAPRVGATLSLNEKTVRARRLRIVLGADAVSGRRARRRSARAGSRRSPRISRARDGGLTPAGTLTNPFPNGIEQPQGSAGGLATGAGGDVHFVDQFGKPAYVQQFSIDLQRELPGTHRWCRPATSAAARIAWRWAARRMRR